MQLARKLKYFSSLPLALAIAKSALAQTATQSAGKGGTTSSLPDAGTTELTYILFIGGVLLFVIGTLKIALSFRD